VKETERMVVITADDYGKSPSVTDSIRNCVSRGRITSVSAMVFMEDSERAASLARKDDMEVGLHLNFTLAYNARTVPGGILDHQGRVGRYLRLSRFAPAVFNPFLAVAFNILFRSQEEEFIKLYGKLPRFYNGHHHMHLCANMRRDRLIPDGRAVRRTFTFTPEERRGPGALYHRHIGSWVARHFISTDSLFSIAPVQDRSRLEHIFDLSSKEDVEIEVHPENREESDLLLGDEYNNLLQRADIGSFRRLCARRGVLKEGEGMHGK
jgi:predicted glycoside hydrolase/deacetylase ChbG (UPF0249 family)